MRYLADYDVIELAAVPALAPAREGEHSAGRPGARLRVVFAMAAAVLMGGCSGADADRAGRDAAVVDSALVRRVDSILAPLVASHAFSGAVVLTRQGAVVYQRGFGSANLEAAVAFAPDTPADGASLAKPVTAAGVWWLVHEGRVELDAPVRRYVAEYPHAATTVRQLLGHSNGLPTDYAWFDRHFGIDQPRTTAAMLGVVARVAPTPRFAPGTRFEYSNLGYDVAAVLIERVTGQSYEDFLQARFFAPLGMRSSFVRPARLAAWRGVRTTGYRWQDSVWAPFDVFDLEAFRGGSNIYFSALDLSRWAMAHATGRAMPAGAFAAAQQFTEVAGERTALTGLNWYCDATRERCYYTGDLNAFFSVVYWDRVRNETVVYLSNSTMPNWTRAALARDLIASLAGAARPSRAPITFERYESATQSRVVGSYIIEGREPFVVHATTSGLRLRIGAGLDYDVFAVEPDVFYVPGLDLWMAFTGQPQPSVMHVQSVFFDTVARRQD